MRNLAGRILAVSLLATPLFAEGFEAGLAAADVTPPIGVPLAGYTARWRLPDWLGFDEYAHYLKPSEGSIDSIRAKALWLRVQDGDGEDLDLVLISLDTIGIDPAARDRVAAGLSDAGAQPDLMLLSATHTHSGPGDLSPNPVFELLVTDNFDETVAGPFIDAVVAVALEAREGMEAADLSTLTVATSGVQKNRVWDEGEVDENLRVLLVTREGDDEVLGSVVNYAVHGTVLGPENLLYGHDLPGAIEQELESALKAERGGNPVVLFLNGAEGDVAPTAGDTTEMTEHAQQLASQVIDALGSASTLSGSAAIRSGDVSLGNAFLSFGNCGIVPWDWLGLGVSLFMPDVASIWQLDLGHLRLMTVPGEPTTRIGADLRASFAPDDEAEVWIVGLTNDHLGYFGKPDEYADHSTGCGTFYGPHGGDKLVKGHRCLTGVCVP